MIVPPVRFKHLASLTTELGLYEHAKLDRPRPEHGFCLDDAARALALTVLQPRPSALVSGLMMVYLDFVEGAQTDDGRFDNRRGADGTWEGAPDTNEHWGRALRALGHACVEGPDQQVRDRAHSLAVRAMGVRSGSLRAMAHAAIGCFEILQVGSEEVATRSLLADARTLLGPSRTTPEWPWPEERLAYANAVVPEAMMAIGVGLDDEQTLRRGLRLLTWLVDRQTLNGHLSVAPVGGWGPPDHPPGFDQQPIEVASLAEASWRAYAITGEEKWADVLRLAAAWFLGDNDSGIALYDSETGAGFDGLLNGGVNLNQGAESTLAALCTMQLLHKSEQAHFSTNRRQR